LVVQNRRFEEGTRMAANRQLPKSVAATAAPLTVAPVASPPMAGPPIANTPVASDLLTSTPVAMAPVASDSVAGTKEEALPTVAPPATGFVAQAPSPAATGGIVAPAPSSAPLRPGVSAAPAAEPEVAASAPPASAARESVSGSSTVNEREAATTKAARALQPGAASLGVVSQPVYSPKDSRRASPATGFGGAPAGSGAFNAPGANNYYNGNNNQLANNGSIAANVYKNSGAAAPALNLFQLERSGDRVRVVDADGSVYTGNVIAAQGIQGQTARKQQLMDSAGQAPSTVNYSFAVHGVNNSSRQRVDFNGSFMQVPIGNVNGMLSNFQNQGQAARVSGTATVGASNQFRVEAAPAQ